MCEIEGEKFVCVRKRKRTKERGRRGEMLWRSLEKQKVKQRVKIDIGGRCMCVEEKKQEKKNVWMKKKVKKERKII